MWIEFLNQVSPTNYSVLMWPNLHPLLLNTAREITFPLSFVIQCIRSTSNGRIKQERPRRGSLFGLKRLEDHTNIASSRPAGWKRPNFCHFLGRIFCWFKNGNIGQKYYYARYSDVKANLKWKSICPWTNVSPQGILLAPKLRTRHRVTAPLQPVNEDAELREKLFSRYLHLGSVVLILDKPKSLCGARRAWSHHYSANLSVGTSNSIRITLDLIAFAKIHEHSIFQHQNLPQQFLTPVNSCSWSR